MGIVLPLAMPGVGVHAVTKLQEQHEVVGAQPQFTGGGAVSPERAFVTVVRREQPEGVL